MRNPMITTGLTTCLLGAAVTATFLLPASLSVPTISAGGSPDRVRLTGVLRDFPTAHPDFGVLPTGGAGHYAGNVAFTLASDGRPIFNTGSDGNGPFDSRVAHWTLNDGAGSTAADEMGLNNGTLLNGPTWTTGHAGGGLHFDGVDDYVEIPSSPEVQITGNITFTGWFKLDDDFDSSSAGTMVIMEKFLDTEHDFHVALAGLDYNRPQVPKGAMVFKVENGSDSDHYRYVWTNRTSWTAGTWYHFAAVLFSADTSQNALMIDGVDDTDPVQAGGIGFIDTDYDAPMRFGGKTIDYNGFATDIYFKGTLDDIAIFNRALVEEDLSPSPGGYKVTTQWEDDATNPIAPHLFLASAGPCAMPPDTAGAPGAKSDGAISSSATFAEWFRDLPGVNQSVAHPITLTRDGAGVYNYVSNAFYPLDNRLYGNEGETHNNYFTYSIRASFEYKECWQQFIEFQGGDGVWIFINGQMVIDLGGVDATDPQYIAVDRLGLTNGQTYTVDLFYAQRQAANSDFSLRTTLDFTQSNNPMTISAAFD